MGGWHQTTDKEMWQMIGAMLAMVALIFLLSECSVRLCRRNHECLFEIGE